MGLLTSQTTKNSAVTEGENLIGDDQVLPFALSAQNKTLGTREI